MNTERVSDIKVGNRIRKNLQDINQLAESIKATGLLHSIVIDSEKRLIAGHRRLEACRLLGWAQIPCRVVDIDDALRGQVDENIARADFLPSEMVAVHDVLLGAEREKARNRQLAGKAPDLRETSPKVASKKQAPRAADKVAAIAGTSRKTLAKAVEVVAAARKEPEKFGALVEEMDRTKRVNGVHRKLKVARQVEALEAEPVPLPEGPYRVIVVDPPWRYESRSTDPTHRGACPYADMSQQELLELPIGSIAHDDSIIWLWTTNAFVADALELLDAWGFQHKTTLSWVKDRMGTGDWLRGKTELCLLGVRGKPVVTLTNQTTALSAPAGEHSAKPKAFYEMVESLCPGSKIDVFARRKREGWEAYGHEIKGRAA